MSKRCCISGCGSKNSRSSGVLLFNAPKDKDILQKWLLVTGHKSLARKYVCSNHFQNTDLVYSFSRTNLKPDAVPSLLLKNFKPVLIESSTNSGSEDSESTTNNKQIDQENEEEISFSEKEGKITHIYKNTLSEKIKHNSDEEIDEYINSAPVDNEDEISDTDSIFDTPRIVDLKRQLRNEKFLYETYKLKITKLKEQNAVLRNKNLTYNSLLKCLKENYIPKKRYPKSRIIVEFLPKTN